MEAVIEDELGAPREVHFIRAGNRLGIERDGGAAADKERHASKGLLHAAQGNRTPEPLSEVHLGETPGHVVGFLPVDGDIAAVRLDELLAADEHPARSAAGVVDTAFVGREHLDEHPTDRPIDSQAAVPTDRPRTCGNALS